MKLELTAGAHALHAQLVMMDYKTKMKQASTVVVNVLFALHVTMESRIKMKPASTVEVSVVPVLVSFFVVNQTVRFLSGSSCTSTATFSV